MVHIVICCIVSCDVLKRIPRECIATMVIDSLNRAACEEAQTLSNCHPCSEVGSSGPQCVEQKALKRMVVQCTECIWDVESVMSGV